MNDKKYIVIKGARENNLKNIDLKIPKDKLIIMTGVSGSGKTSLAFDTIYAEGQRRYIESLSTYARQFLNDVDKPDVDSIEGLSPSISIDQKTTNRNPRSTVGTVTEIYDFLRLLYARIGKAYCPTHHLLITSQTIGEMCDKVMEAPEGEKVIIMSPIATMEKGRHEKTFEFLRKEGFNKVTVDGEMMDLADDIIIEKNIKHNIAVIVDRVKVREDVRGRIFSSIETACNLSKGLCVCKIGEEIVKFNEDLSCPEGDFSLPKLEPNLFSFNSPLGACPVCHGLGYLQRVSIDSLVPDKTKSINEHCIRFYKNIMDTDNIEWQRFAALLNFYNIPRDTAWCDLTADQQDIILHGSREPIAFTVITSKGGIYKRTQVLEGVADLIERRYLQTESNFGREYYGSYLANEECPVCHGAKLSKEVLSVVVGKYNIDEITNLTIEQLYKYLGELELSDKDRHIAALVLKSIRERLRFLIDVGLDYLTLKRHAATLSGGESQRIRLATQIGSRLVGVLYVLDEPSIGLHPRDNDRLIKSLKEMRDLGNTLIVVEHDEAIMRQSDWIIDVGPYAGHEGGEIIAEGTPEEVMQAHTLTGDYLSGRKKISVPLKRSKGNGKSLIIRNARSNNLKNLDVTIPLGEFIVVTGVSGSGKSTLVDETLVKNFKKIRNRARISAGVCDEIEGLDNIEHIIEIDQSPIGRTPRSNPATYTGVFDNIRDLFAATMDAKMKGYKKGRFSFNVKGGRCEKCRGDGVIRISMNFLPDVYVKCETCNGKRYNEETLKVLYKGKNIYDVLNMTVSDACKFFENIPKIKTKLDVLNSVGLGYIKLGQSATTLSGGEAQRVKLASELYKSVDEKTLYVLDEPTVGLHSYDVNNLVAVLHQIVSKGGTVLVIEHNLDVIKQADYVIDLGPEGGIRGGEIVATGTPEEICQNENSYTGQYLKKVLK